MFTGIISAIGDVVGLEPRGGDVRLTINTGDLSLTDVSLGDSIACNGACLTAVELTGQGFIADVSVETLNLTTIGQWETGSRVNLEKAMQATDRLEDILFQDMLMVLVKSCHWRVMLGLGGSGCVRRAILQNI